jgi:prevent-host-death family protein
VRRVGLSEARSRFAQLIDEVGRGETITITKHGVPVALLVPPTRTATPAGREALAGLRAFRTRHPLRSVTIRELIDEGRS